MTRFVLCLCAVALSGVFAGCGRDAASERPIRAPGDLNGRPVAHMSSGFQQEKLRRLAPGIAFQPYVDYALAFEALREGKIDAISLGRSYLDLWQAKFPGAFREAFPYADDPCAFLVRRFWPHLARFNAELAKMRARGETKRIYEKWLGALKEGRALPEGPRRTAPDTAPVVRVSAFAASEPHCFVDRNMRVVGSCAEIVGTVLDRMGFRVVFEINSFEGMCAAVESGRADIACGWIYTGGNIFTTVDVTEPYDVEKMCVIVRDGQAGRGYGWQALVRSFRQTFVTEGRWKMLLEGLEVTLVITFFMALLGALVAFPVCALRSSRVRPCAFLGTAYVRLFQGTPILVQLLLFYYVIFAHVDISGVTVAVIAFGMNLGANLGEALRSAVSAVPRGQTEAALALGYGPWRAFFEIVLPQALRTMLPVGRGELVAHFKMTSVVGFIAVTDLTKASDLIRSRTYEALFPIVATAAIYFLIAGVIAWTLDRLHRRWAD